MVTEILENIQAVKQLSKAMLSIINLKGKNIYDNILLMNRVQNNKY